MLLSLLELPPLMLFALGCGMLAVSFIGLMICAVQAAPYMEEGQSHDG